MGADPAALAKAKQCFTCHDAKSEMIGRSFSDIARRFKGVSNARAMLAGVSRQDQIARVLCITGERPRCLRHLLGYQ
jgi:cytochrome c551/c552